MKRYNNIKMQHNKIQNNTLINKKYYIIAIQHNKAQTIS